MVVVLAVVDVLTAMTEEETLVELSEVIVDRDVLRRVVAEELTIVDVVALVEELVEAEPLGGELEGELLDEDMEAAELDEEGLAELELLADDEDEPELLDELLVEEDDEDAFVTAMFATATSAI